jgi:hypothetical protein
MLVFIPGGHDFATNQDLDKEQKWAQLNEIMFTEVTHAPAFKDRITSVVFIAFLV